MVLYRSRGRAILISVSNSPDSVASASSASSFSCFSSYPCVSSFTPPPPPPPPPSPPPPPPFHYHYYGNHRVTLIFHPQPSHQIASNREDRKVTALLVLNFMHIRSDVWKFPMVISDSSCNNINSNWETSTKTKIKARTASITTIRITRKDQLTYSRNRGILRRSRWRKQTAPFSCKLYLIDGNIS